MSKEIVLIVVCCVWWLVKYVEYLNDFFIDGLGVLDCWSNCPDWLYNAINIVAFLFASMATPLLVCGFVYIIFM